MNDFVNNKETQDLKTQVSYKRLDNSLIKYGFGTREDLSRVRYLYSSQ